MLLNVTSLEMQFKRNKYKLCIFIFWDIALPLAVFGSAPGTGTVPTNVNAGMSVRVKM